MSMPERPSRRTQSQVEYEPQCLFADRSESGPIVPRRVARQSVEMTLGWSLRAGNWPGGGVAVVRAAGACDGEGGQARREEECGEEGPPGPDGHPTARNAADGGVREGILACIVM